jgi:hypothetical protein
MIPLPAFRTGLLLAALVTAMPANAAELNVVAAGAVRGIVGGMMPDVSTPAAVTSILPNWFYVKWP